MLSRSGIECTFERSPLRSRRCIAFVCLCLTVLAIVLAAPAGAEDEDTSSSVYLVFDPETGEFVTSHDPNQALPNQTGLEDSNNAARPSDRARGGDDARVETSAGGFSATLVVLMIVGAIAVTGAGVVFLRRARQHGG